MTVDPTWVEIPAETMKELRERNDRAALHRSPHLSPQQFGGALGQPEGFPVHFVDGKWYVEVKPRGMSYTQAREFLQIQQLLEVGELKHDEKARRIGVWQGEQWLWVPELAFQELDRPAMEMSRNMKLTPEAVQEVKEWLARMDEEEERLALRRALEEAQAEEDS
jgi:hypothetical protein